MPMCRRRSPAMRSRVEISDDGGGFPADNVFGRGLTGMHERVRALSGSLSLLRADERTYVRCRLPLGDVATTRHPSTRRNRAGPAAPARTACCGSCLPR